MGLGIRCQVSGFCLGNQVIGKEKHLTEGHRLPVTDSPSYLTTDT